jgi:hypothetical protein
VNESTQQQNKSNVFACVTAIVQQTLKFEWMLVFGIRWFPCLGAAFDPCTILLGGCALLCVVAGLYTVLTNWNWSLDHLEGSFAAHSSHCSLIASGPAISNCFVKGGPVFPGYV